MKNALMMTAICLTAMTLLASRSSSKGAVQTDAPPEFGEFHGVLLNEQCATRQPEWLPFADEHSLNCAMLPICFLSGYYLIVDQNNFMKLDILIVYILEFQWYTQRQCHPIPSPRDPERSKATYKKQIHNNPNTNIYQFNQSSAPS